MRIVKDKTTLTRIAGGRQWAQIPVPCIYLTWRDREWLQAGTFRMRDRLDELKRGNPGVQVWGESTSGQIERIE